MSFGGAARLAGRMAGPGGLVALMLALGGCDRVGDPLQALGAGIPAPDEFQVMQYEPPVVPDAYDLPEPQPGAPSPRAPNPQRDAVAAILGPGAVGASTAGPSAGEQVLLSSADAASTSGDIRVQLEQDRARAEAAEEYEPPTLWQLFGFASDEEELDESQLIDPVAEAERLQGEGLATPVDPEAEARAAAAEEEESRPRRMITGRLPNNKIGPGTEPAF